MDNRHPTGDDKENRSVRRAMLERQADEEQKQRLEEGEFDQDGSPARKSAAKRSAERIEGSDDEDQRANEVEKRNRTLANQSKDRAKIAAKPLVQPNATDKKTKK